MSAFSIIYGVCSGAYMSLAMSVSGVICGIDRLAVVSGNFVGSPIESAPLDMVGHRTDYVPLILWMGIVKAAGAGVPSIK
ncbi:hypothetical protein BGX23_002907 [Mortierella sp. AD031]|nr:hypothetical protein BGX23_002907 [Mortierella sp. AD031]KAG0198129.1 hypothetical protein BGX33_012577 [Mortierella sp. NVP41]